jgi:hypothetical protein
VHHTLIAACAEVLGIENETMSIGRTPNGTEIAGWILKGDPKVYDLDAALENARRVERWSVYDNYRKDLMGEGQRCFLWRSGPNGAVVAAGYVTGPVRRDTTDPSAWVDPGKAAQAEWFVPVELYALWEPILRAELKAHPVLSQVELLRAKQMSNPTIVTSEELDALDELLEIAGVQLPFFAIIGTGARRFGVDVHESGDGFVVLQETEDGDFQEISDHHTPLDAILAAADAASAQIEAEPVIDGDDGGTFIGQVDTDEGGFVGLYKVEGGYEGAVPAEDEDGLYSSDTYPTLPDLLRSLFEPTDASPTDLVDV